MGGPDIPAGRQSARSRSSGSEARKVRSRSRNVSVATRPVPGDLDLVFCQPSGEPIDPGVLRTAWSV